MFFNLVKNHATLKNMRDYGFHDLDPRMTVHHLFDGIKCVKLSKSIAAIYTNCENNRRDFDTAVASLLQDISKRGQLIMFYLSTVSQTRPEKRQKMMPNVTDTFKEKIKNSKYAP